MRTPAPKLLVLAFAVLALALVPAAFAGKGGGNGAGGGRPGGGGGGGGGYTVTVDQPAPYRFGQAITVTTNTPVYPNNTGPWIALTCVKDGVKVLGTDHAGFPGGWYYGWPFYLGPTGMWSGGAADCTVKVTHQSNNKIVTDASTSFHVDP